MAKAAGILLLLASLPLWADLRYQMRCEMESSEPMLSQMGALAEAARNCSVEVLQSGSRQLIRNARMTQLFHLEEGYLIRLDHVDKTRRRISFEELQQGDQASLEQFQAMGARMNIATRKLPAPRVIEGYLSEGVESNFTIAVPVAGLRRPMQMSARVEVWLSAEAPGGKDAAKGIAGKATSPQFQMMMQFLRGMPGGDQILREGALPTGQLMETRMRMELPGGDGVSVIEIRMRAENFATSPINPEEFAVPADYREVQ
jgi:hypothetical protein